MPPKTKLPTAKYSVFVIMPFDDEFTVVYSDLIQPAFPQASFEVTRADTKLNQRNILKDVVVGIEKADLVVADLTRLNPNVLYELGVAHGLNRKTVLISQTLEDIPFDLKSYRFIPYSEHFAEAKRLLEKLSAIAEGFLDGSTLFGNPVSDSLGIDPGLTTQAASPSAPPARRGREKKRLENLKRNLGQGGPLDWLVAIESSANGIAKSSERIGTKIDTLGQRLTHKTELLKRESESPQRGSAARMQAIIRECALDLSSFSRDLQTELPRFSKQWSDFDESAILLLTAPHKSDPSYRAQLKALRQPLESLRGNIEGAMTGIQSLRDAAQQLEDSRLTFDLSQAAHKAVGVVDKLLGQFETALASSNRMLSLLEDLDLNSDPA